MNASAEKTAPPPPLVALAGWLVPGLGYWLLGQRARALTIGITIIALFLGGILIAGIRAIDVPGYDDFGKEIQVVTGPSQRSWILWNRPLSELANKPWYICQVMAGPLNIVASKLSLDATSAPKTKARL